MGYVIRCDCGTDIRGETDDEIVENAQDHAEHKHSLIVTREQALALAERE
jgi:predicted small metal-binding protein